MKPTQEQILQWARDAGFHRYAPDFPDMFEAFAALAYEAGRKDENEACVEVIMPNATPMEIAAAIRARREQ